MKANVLMLVWPVILVAGILYFMPLLTRPGIFFSATVAPDFPRSSDGRRLLRSWRLQLLVWSVAAMVATVLLAPGHPLLGGLVPMFVLLAAVGCAYWRNFRAVHAGYGVSRGEVRRTSLSPEQHRESVRVALMLPPFLALGLTAWYLHLRWSEIPERFPVHWGIDGQPDGWATRDLHGVFAPLLMGALLNVLLLVLVWVIARLSRNTVMRYVTVRSLEVLLYPLTLTFVIIGLLPLMRPANAATIVLLTMVPMLLTIVGVLYWSYKKISVPAPEADASPEPQRDGYWKAGMFYYNPSDPAILVAKRVGIGYTFNFANKMSWLVLAGILLIALLPVLVLRAK
ncbi:MAG TPA: DUF5808 domain-containing protein [Candidatus Bathyarchaeia archaeon]|nr:DUF5808 domain-containing protein [Candidatus Bathyarchaeia archaeon]